MNKPWWQSTTILGAILAAVAHVLTADLSNKVAVARAVAEGAGAIIAVAGARDAVAKNGKGK